LVGTPTRWLLGGGGVVQVEAEPAGEFLEADRDAGLAGAHARKQGGLLGVGGRLLPLAREQAAHPRGCLIQRCCHGAMIPHGGLEWPLLHEGPPKRGVLDIATSVLADQATTRGLQQDGGWAEAVRALVEP
jgi:hypothetical protein